MPGETHPSSLPDLLERAVAWHRAGDFATATRLYLEILQREPRHFEALHQLGVARAQAGDAAAAVRHLTAAIAVNPQSAEAHVHLAHARMATGETEAALASYDQALALRPQYPEALYSRGNALQAQQRHAEAVQCYDRALALAPDRPEILTNRGNALLDLKRFDEALADYDRALALRPDAAMLHNNRGNTLRELGRFEEALASLDRALAIAPDYVDALNNRGNTLQDLQRYEEALASFDLARVSRPNDAVVYHNRGNALQDLQRYEEALASYDHALAIRSDFVEALRGRGNALQKLRRFEEAIACYEKALVIQPDYVEALNSRGIALWNLKQPEEALLSYNRALALKHDYAEAINSRGVALMDLKRHEEALASYDRALALKPDYHDALLNRGEVLRNLKRHEEAARSYTRLLELAPDYSFAKGDLLHAKMLCCDWEGLTVLAESIEKDLHAGKKSVAPFGFQAISSSARDLRRCAEVFAAENYPQAQAPVWTGERYQNARIRIGYVSGEFRYQATSVLIAGLFELHDKNCFELFALDNGWDDASEIRGRINRASDEIVDIRRLGDREAAAAIKRRQIDILVNLNGYFGEARSGIFSLRPSPVQVNYLGFPGTLGVDYMDYILADRHVIPPEHEACYTEKVVYLPDTYQVNDSKRGIAERTPTRAEVELPDTGFVFCCFNNNYKITPQIFDRWMRLLNEVPGSVLWLLEDNAAVPRNLRREAEVRGVASERLVFAPRVKFEDHLARHRLADLFLDTLPYNAHTTANDALWAGLPLLTCQGTTFPGRVAASLLNAIGLNELITSSLDEYEALAVELAMNPKRLAEIRSKLARNRGTYPLFDTDRFRRHIEAAYTTMWERYQRGEPPASFAVAPTNN
jgi:predicted O-linked N-acetylglucosamine transferase (SPINDLY family)